MSHYGPRPPLKKDEQDDSSIRSNVGSATAMASQSTGYSTSSEHSNTNRRYPLHLQQHEQYQNSSSATNDVASTATASVATDNFMHEKRIRTGKHLRAEKTRLEDYHVAYRVPLHVPDNAYRAYLQGKQTKNSRDNNSICHKVCCAHVCIGFSTVAILFLCFIGFLIDTQPILMGGTLPTAKGVANDGSGKIVIKYILPVDGEVLPMARTAYRAAYAYMVCILLALCVLHPCWMRSQIYRLRHRYQDIPDHVSNTDSTLPHIHTTPNGADGHSHHHADAATGGPSWMGTIWNRCSFVIRQRLTEIGWYQPRRSRRRSMRREE